MLRNLLLLEVLLVVPSAVPALPVPPQAPPVVKPACVCGDSCKCAAGECPGKCPVRTLAGPPVGFPPAPSGYEWRPDARSACGWGLFQTKIPMGYNPAVAPPVRDTPVPAVRYVRVCEGGTCRLVAVPAP